LDIFGSNVDMKCSIIWNTYTFINDLDGSMVSTLQEGQEASSKPVTFLVKFN